MQVAVSGAGLAADESYQQHILQDVLDWPLTNPISNTFSRMSRGRLP